MRSATEIIMAYTRGEIGLEECNKQLSEAATGVQLDPERCKLTEEMIGNGWGLLDTGTGFMDPVRVEDMELQNADCGEMVAFCLLKGKLYQVHGTKLVEAAD